MKTSKYGLVLTAIRLAELAHRKCKHRRKAPRGEDRPPYFIHLAEAAWMVQAAGYDESSVAAAYLHDIIEDCGYTENRLARECGSKKVARMVKWLSEPEKEIRGTDGTKHDNWDERNSTYLKRMKSANEQVLAISCADKTSNMLDMIRFMEKGYKVNSFTKRDFPTQAEKFRKLEAVYRGVAPQLLSRYRATLKKFVKIGK